MKKSELKGVIRYMLLLLAISSFFTANMKYVAADPPPPWYCGYVYDSTPTWGVKANIYTLPTGVILNTQRFQWVSVILHYTPNYWLQVGYKKWWIWFLWFPVLNTHFYYERVDSEVTQHFWIWYLIPTAGVTYTYIIKHLGVANHWEWYVKLGSTTGLHGYFSPNPYSPVDFQAFSESTSPRNVITGTHFSQLSKASGGSSWTLWDDHFPVDHSPYVIQEMGHYEFKGSGGYG